MGRQPGVSRLRRGSPLAPFSEGSRQRPVYTDGSEPWQVDGGGVPRGGPRFQNEPESCWCLPRSPLGYSTLKTRGPASEELQVWLHRVFRAAIARKLQQIPHGGIDDS